MRTYSPIRFVALLPALAACGQILPLPIMPNAKQVPNAPAAPAAPTDPNANANLTSGYTKTKIVCVQGKSAAPLQNARETHFEAFITVAGDKYITVLLHTVKSATEFYAAEDTTPEAKGFEVSTADVNFTLSDDHTLLTAMCIPGTSHIGDYCEASPSWIVDCVSKTY